MPSAQPSVWGSALFWSGGSESMMWGDPDQPCGRWHLRTPPTNTASFHQWPLLVQTSRIGTVSWPLEMASCLIYFELWEGQGLNNAMTQQSVIRWARSKRPSSVLDVRVMEGKQCLRDSRDVLEAIGRDTLEEDGRDLLQSHPVILPLLLSRINSMNIVRAIVWCIGTYNEI